MFQRVFTGNRIGTDAEFVKMARRQVEQQQEIDRLTALIQAQAGRITELEQNVLARTTRIHLLEMAMRKNDKDVTLAAAAISDMLSDLLPATDARVERALSNIQTLFARMTSAEQALDCLERCDKNETQTR